MLKRLAASWPHQPSSRGIRRLASSSRTCRSCTNTPDTAPGPELTYLYEHQQAKSTFQSQLERHVAHGVRPGQTRSCAHRVRRFGDGLEVVPLSGVVVHPTHHHCGEFVARFVDGGQPVFFADQVLTFLGATSMRSSSGSPPCMRIWLHKA